MSAGVSTVKKLFCRGKRRKESLSRKIGEVPRGSKYLLLHMTHPSLLQSFLSLPAAVKKGPTPFEHTHGEYWIAQNFQIPYCEFVEAT